MNAPLKGLNREFSYLGFIRLISRVVHFVFRVQVNLFYLKHINPGSVGDLLSGKSKPAQNLQKLS